jgi:hypothetical protein
MSPDYVDSDLTPEEMIALAAQAFDDADKAGPIPTDPDSAGDIPEQGRGEDGRGRCGRGLGS